MKPDILAIDLEKVEKRIKNFIINYVEESKAEGVILGLSGGLDSSTVAAIASLALGDEKVLGIIMPEEETYNELDIKHAELVAKKFGINTHLIDISSPLNSFYKSIPIFDSSNRVCKGNIKARFRMIYLYYYANILNRLVLGTSDKSETMMGYFTKWGDGASDFTPIINLYKTQVKQLAKYIGVPIEIIKKPPSPKLWPNHTANQELGISYEILDLILYGLENQMDTKEISNKFDVNLNDVKKIKARCESMEHKRRMPASALW